MMDAQRAETLREEQVRAWTEGERPSVETLLERHPEIAEDDELLLDLIYNEYLLRTRSGETPSPEEFQRRFPAQATALMRQIELHNVLAYGSTITAAGAESLQVTGNNASRKANLQPLSLSGTFGRYRIDKLLGRGGMGAVYQAYDTRLDRPVALKVMLFPDDATNAFNERFDREARAAAAFDHPNLCPVFDVGEIDGVHYLTMPLLRGESLFARLQSTGRLDWPDAVRIVATLARALQVAHAAGVVHRDLKPSNIVLKDGEPVIIDFGLAHRPTSEASKLTPSEAILGTPAYLAPEQINADIGPIGPATDLYALGTMLFELLTGSPPFRGSVFDVMRGVMSGARPSVRSQQEDLPAELDRIIVRAMSKKPTDRFASMTEFADALGSIPATSRHATSVRRKPKLLPANASNRKLWMSGIAGAAVVALLLLAWGILTPVPESVQEPENIRQGASPTDHLTADSVWTGQFVFRPPHDLKGDVKLRITKRQGSEFEAVYNTENDQFEWIVSGKIGDGEIHMRFLKAIRDNPDATLVGQAFLDGTIEKNTMRVVFRMPSQESTADMTLTRNQ